MQLKFLRLDHYLLSFHWGDGIKQPKRRNFNMLHHICEQNCVGDAIQEIHGVATENEVMYKGKGLNVLDDFHCVYTLVLICLIGALWSDPMKRDDSLVQKRKENRECKNELWLEAVDERDTSTLTSHTARSSSAMRSSDTKVLSQNANTISIIFVLSTETNADMMQIFLEINNF